MAAVEESSNEEVLAGLAARLADGVEAALPGWVEGHVRRLATAYFGSADATIMTEARRAGDAARTEIGPKVRALLELDPDEQWTSPLALVRAAAAYPAAVLRRFEVPPVVRDPQAEAQFPYDDYDLVPTKLGDLDPDLHELSMAWGAAKAFVVKARHRELGS
jgi:hypothetical protein